MHVSMIHAHSRILSQSQKHRYCTLEGLEGLEAFLLGVEVLSTVKLWGAGDDNSVNCPSGAEARRGRENVGSTHFQWPNGYSKAWRVDCRSGFTRVNERGP